MVGAAVVDPDLDLAAVRHFGYFEEGTVGEFLTGRGEGVLIVCFPGTGRLGVVAVGVVTGHALGALGHGGQGEQEQDKQAGEAGKRGGRRGHAVVLLVRKVWKQWDGRPEVEMQKIL